MPGAARPCTIHRGRTGGTEDDMFGRKNRFVQHAHDRRERTWQGGRRHGMSARQRRNGMATPLLAAALLFPAMTGSICQAGASARRNGNTGLTWHVATSPDITGALLSVSCPATSFCMAVGRSDSGPGVIEVWQGLSWARLPIPTFAKSALLTGVSCLSVTSCIVVGQKSQGGPMAMRYARGVWQAFALPNLVGGFDGGIVAVSCGGPSWCIAVGSEVGKAKPYSEGFAYSYNGHSWSLTNVAQPTYGSLLDGVYCSRLTPPSCVAVGLRFSAYTVGFPPPYAVPYALIEDYNGTSWVEEPRPAVVGRLMGVGCGESECLAVGVNQVDENKLELP